MSATIQETLSVSRSTVVELLAALQGASGLVHNDDKRLNREYRSDVIAGIAERFRLQLLGPWPADDEERAIDPTEIELLARSSEFEAEMIDQCLEQRVQHEQTRGHLEARDGRSGQLREYARRIRQAGREDVSFPTSGEMLENLRLEMNARREADDAR